MISELKMAIQRLVMLFIPVILCMYCVDVSSVNSMSQGYLPGTVACKTYSTSKIDCSLRSLIDIPILDRNLTTWLNLSHNLLKEIHGAPFDELSILFNLDLSHNMISLLNSTVFRGLSSLQNVDLSYNLLSALPREIFRDQFKLVKLDIRVNPLYDIPSQTLATLYSLQYLYLTYFGSALDIIMRDLYNSTKLEELQLVGIDSPVTNTTLQPLAGLQIQKLTLLWKALSTQRIDEAAFTPFTSIQRLITDFIALPALGSLHSPLQTLLLLSFSEKFPYILQSTTLQVLSKFKESLKRLELFEPNLYQIDNGAFMWMPNLIKLGISAGKVQTVAQYSFRGLTALQILDLQDNQLTAVPSEAISYIGKFTSLQYLDLSRNSLSTIADDAFLGVSSVTYLNLGNNKYIHKLPVYARWLNVLPNLKHLILGTFESSNSDMITISLPTPLLSLQIFEIRNVLVKFEKNFCLTFPNAVSLIISGAGIAHFQAFALSLYECVFLKELDLSDSVAHTDLLDLEHTTINIPTLEDLSLAKNTIKSITQILFIKAPNLTSLYLTDNQIKTIDSAIANAFKCLIHLSIDGNALVSLSGLEDLTDLKHLSAARNQIIQVPLWLISKPNGLGLMTLDLSVNPFHCSCEIENFRKWIKSDTNTQLKPGQYSCASPETLAGVSISDIELDCRSYTAFYIGVSFPFVILFCMLIVFLIRYRWHIKYKLFLLYRNYHPFPDNNNEFEMLQLQYHAYVSYNETSADDEWVMNDLQPNMEEGPEPVKLCIKTRDFIPGHSLIESISESIHQSRKSIFVLSPNFVESNWCHHEMEMAKMMLLDENLDVIILVLLHDIPDNKMTLSLRQLLCKKEYLKWPKDRAGQRLFWQSLRQELKSPIQVDRRFCM